MSSCVSQLLLQCPSDDTIALGPSGTLHTERTVNSLKWALCSKAAADAASVHGPCGSSLSASASCPLAFPLLNWKPGMGPSFTRFSTSWPRVPQNPCSALSHCQLRAVAALFLNHLILLPHLLSHPINSNSALAHLIEIRKQHNNKVAHCQQKSGRDENVTGPTHCQGSGVKVSEARSRR